MAKNLKLNIKNVQIAGAINLGGLKEKLSLKKDEEEKPKKKKKATSTEKKETTKKETSKATSKNAAPPKKETKEKSTVKKAPVKKKKDVEEKPASKKTPLKEKKKEEAAAVVPPVVEEKVVVKEEKEALKPLVKEKKEKVVLEPVAQEKKEKVVLGPVVEPKQKPEEKLGPVFKKAPEVPAGYQSQQQRRDRRPQRPSSRNEERSGSGFKFEPFKAKSFSSERKPPSQHGELVKPVVFNNRKDAPQERRGPRTLSSRPSSSRPPSSRPPSSRPPSQRPMRQGDRPQQRFDRGDRTHAPRPISLRGQDVNVSKNFPNENKGTGFAGRNDKGKKPKTKDRVSTLKGAKRGDSRVFDSRERHGMVSVDEGVWKSKKKSRLLKGESTIEVVRPSQISVRLPISMKDLAQEMKLKAAELLKALFNQGMMLTLNSMLDDADVVQLLGSEFGCDITIDTSEEERIRISEKTVQEEIESEGAGNITDRPPVIAFMGHVDHGKTSLVDAIRKSNIVAKEAGAITQHIGAFTCSTSHGKLTIIDTPGHEAFTLMRERGAQLTDIVVLVIAGDEGVKEQTIEAIKQAKEAASSLVVAITKCDRPNYDIDTVYRQLADHNLLPEAWGGQIVTVRCSAITKEGLNDLLEMLALQAEVLELKANPEKRARGTVIEAQMQQGLGAVATVLVQNGTLNEGDSLVFGSEWARVKTMRDEQGKQLKVAPPSKPVQITGLSGLPDSGDEFIVVGNDKEAKSIAGVRKEQKRQQSFMKKAPTLESFMEATEKTEKKQLKIILRGDVQGSVEALSKALHKIKSDKIGLTIISEEVGQISESDVEAAATSEAILLGFHTQVEAHAEPLIKERKVKLLEHDVIYHAVDEVKGEMRALLDKLPQENEQGSAEVIAVFKSSHLGLIAGCLVSDGTIARNHKVRVRRGKELVFEGSIASIKRVQEDVNKVSKGVECGILLNGFNQCEVGDIIEAYDITYIAQDL